MRKSFRCTTCIFRIFSSVPPATHSSVPFSRPCLTSYVPCLTSLFLAPVLCPLSHVSVPGSRPMSPVSRLCSWLPSYVPCLTSLFLASGPLYPVSRDLSSVSQPPSLVRRTLLSYAAPLKKICRHMKYKDFTFMQAFKLL